MQRLASQSRDCCNGPSVDNWLVERCSCNEIPSDQFSSLGTTPNHGGVFHSLIRASVWIRASLDRTNQQEDD